VRDLGAARGEILRLEELHGVAYEELAEARIVLGEHALVTDVLAGAIQKYPLREKLTECLMVALYRCGRPSDALGVYSEFATRLDEELGLNPSKALRKLEEDILLQRSSLDFVAPRAGVGPPIHLHTPAIRMIGRRQDYGS
jgi:DNA-binding SARP family transcriptional activator